MNFVGVASVVCVQVVMHTVCGQVCVQVVNVMYIVCTGCMFSVQCLFTEFIYIVSTLFCDNGRVQHKKNLLS